MQRNHNFILATYNREPGFRGLEAGIRNAATQWYLHHNGSEQHGLSREQPDHSVVIWRSPPGVTPHPRDIQLPEQLDHQTGAITRVNRIGLSVTYLPAPAQRDPREAQPYASIAVDFDQTASNGVRSPNQTIRATVYPSIAAPGTLSLDLVRGFPGEIPVPVGLRPDETFDEQERARIIAWLTGLADGVYQRRDQGSLQPGDTLT